MSSMLTITRSRVFPGVLTIFAAILPHSLYGAEPLTALLKDVSEIGNGDLAAARSDAETAGATGVGIKHPSQPVVTGKAAPGKTLETTVFSGPLKIPALPAGRSGIWIYSLAIHSDDGCDVIVKQDGKKIFEDKRALAGQHLPSIGQSFHPLSVNLIPGQTYDVEVTYTNIQYTPRYGTPDIDGATLYLFLNLPVEIKYVDRDDPVKTWTSAGEPKNLPPNQPVYSGKETGDLVSWSLPSDAFSGSTFAWKAERKTPSSPAVSVTGASGVNKTQWQLTAPIDWLPGNYIIKCSITKDGVTIPFEFEQFVGARTDDVVVIGWIDPAMITLSATGVDAGLVSILPVGGLSATSGDNAKLKAALLIKHISEEGIATPFQIDFGPIMDGTNFTTPFTAADKTYVLRWMFKYGSNSAPPTSLAKAAPADLKAEGISTIFDQATLDTFVAAAGLGNFKLINHYQVKCLTGVDGKFSPSRVTSPINKKQVWIGSTKDPSYLYTMYGLADWFILLIGETFKGYPADGLFPGQPSPNNLVCTKKPTETMLCNEGRPEPAAMSAFTNLTGAPAVFDIWSTITFYPDISYYSAKISPSTHASLTRAPKPTQFYQGRINTQIYPTYWIYVNGVLKAKQIQDPNPAVLLPNTDKCQ